MSTLPLYCHNCKKNYNARKEDLELMRKHNKNFNSSEYKDGCFFKDLGQLKRSLKENNDN